MVQTMPPSRALVLNVMLSLLVSAAVFVVVSQIVIVPQMARQQIEIASLQHQVNELRSALEEEAAAAVQQAKVETVTASATGQAGAGGQGGAAGQAGAPGASAAPAKAAVQAVAK